MNSYEELENAIRTYKYIDLSKASREIRESNGKKIMEDILKRLKPLILSRAKHFFGYVSEDMLQDGILKAIELINGYEPDKNKSFAAYMKFMMNAFFWEQKRRELLNRKREEIKQIREEYSKISYTEEDFERAHVEELMSCLEEGEKTLVKRHILGGLNLKSTCQSMGITYRQGRYMRQKAIIKLKAGYTKNM